MRWSFRTSPEASGAELRDNLSMELLRPYRIALAIFVLHPGVLNAQELATFMRVLSVAASGNKTPVIADIELRTEADTPWGTITETLTGKYWRSRDGKSRQDDAFGNTLLYTASTAIWVDHEAKSAISDIGPGSMFINPIFSESLGKKTIGNRTAIGGRNYLGGKKSKIVGEIWTDASLGVPLEVRSKGPGVESIQRLINIEERDRDPKLF